MTEERTETASLSKLELLQIAIAIIVFFSPLLYLIGIAFWQGFLSAYGIHPSFFPPTLFEIYGYVYVRLRDDITLNILLAGGLLILTHL